MSWFDTNRSIVRVVILALFIVSMLGPWTFDLINVPAEYECDKPFVRLEGDFCGYPMSGFSVFFLFIGGFFSNLVAWGSGAFTGRAREFLVGLSLLPILPFFTTFLFAWEKETSRLRTINLIAWTLALIPTLIVFVTQIKDPLIQLCGLWFYIVMAVSAVIVEILILAGERKPIT